MGWIVYSKHGDLISYHRKPGPAKAAVTRYNRELEKGYRSYPEVGGCCSYRDFEGILMGLRGDALKMWRFCNTEIG